jgi:hypothetical protein
LGAPLSSRKLAVEARHEPAAGGFHRELVSALNRGKVVKFERVK